MGGGRIIDFVLTPRRTCSGGALAAHTTAVGVDVMDGAAFDGNGAATYARARVCVYASLRVGSRAEHASV